MVTFRRCRLTTSSTTPSLDCEVADSSLDHDRETKAPLYAASGVPEYWIVDVKARRVSVYDTIMAERYGRLREFSIGERVVPSAFADTALDVADLFV